MRLAASPVSFNEDRHQYLLGDKRLSGITSLIRDALKLGYANLDDEDPAVVFNVERAADYGTAVHHAIEVLDRDGEARTLWEKADRFKDGSEDFWDVSRELEGYKANREGYETIASEYTVSDEDRYATNIDLVWLKDGEVWLADTKTNNVKSYPGGKSKFKEYLSWQLSIEAFLFERQNPGLKVAGLLCNWLHKGERELFTVERKPDEDVESLLSTPWAVVGGRTVYGTATGAALAKKHYGGPTLAKKTIDSIASALRRAAEIEKRVKEFKADLEARMKEAGCSAWDAGPFKVTLGEDTVATTLDAERLKAERPDIYAEYSRQSRRKGQFKIKLKDNQ